MWFFSFFVLLSSRFWFLLPCVSSSVAFVRLSLAQSLCVLGFSMRCSGRSAFRSCGLCAFLLYGFRVHGRDSFPSSLGSWSVLECLRCWPGGALLLCPVLALRFFSAASFRAGVRPRSPLSPWVFFSCAFPCLGEVFPLGWGHLGVVSFLASSPP